MDLRNVVLLLFFVMVPAASSDIFRICYYYFGSPQDLGWTFAFNDARVAAHGALSLVLEKASNDTIRLESFYRQNVFFNVPNFEVQVAYDVKFTGCAIFVANNRLLFGDEVTVARRFPNISFFVLNDELVLTAPAPNLAYFGERDDGGYFIAGAVAAAQSRTCVAILIAYRMYRNPYDAANGFAAGARWINATLPIFVIEIGSWSNPTFEAAVTQALLQYKHCEVIAHYSDTHTVDETVASYNNNFTIP